MRKTSGSPRIASARWPKTRLRAVRIGGGELGSSIYAREWDAAAAVLGVTVSVVGPSFAYSMRPIEQLFDYDSRVWFWAEPLRSTPSLSTHGGDAGFIMQSLSEALDALTGDYLRVNAEACG